MTRAVELVMAGLKHKLDDIRQLIPLDRPVAVLDVPVHHNVGDLLIALGTERWLAANGYTVALTACLHSRLESTLLQITDDMTIVCHGGGNFGDLYPQHQQFRERVVAAKPNNRIVLLPQSVHYANPMGLRHAADIYARHPDLHILLRDEPSFDLVRRAMSTPVYLFPDMAHFLWGDADFPHRNEYAKGLLNIVRTDLEATPHQLAAFATHVASVDWDDLISPFGGIALRIAARQFARDANGTMHGWVRTLWEAHTARVVRYTIARFSAYETIATSRLHGLILACLLGKRVKLVDNSYGKLERYRGAWLEGYDLIEVSSARHAA